MMETLAATAHQITVNGGAEADARGLDGLIGHRGEREKAKQSGMLALCPPLITPQRSAHPARQHSGVGSPPKSNRARLTFKFFLP
jgi:hypothetical protein